MIKKILIGVAALVLLLVAVGLFASKEYVIERRITIDAAPTAIHAHVGDLTKWPAWSPWVEADPSIVTTYGEITSGVGATQRWTSASGDGELTVTQSLPERGISYEMAFVGRDGSRIPAICAMTYRPVDGGTEVVWSMRGSWKGAVPPVVDGWMKLLSPIMIGGSYDTGLEKLKRVVEAGG